MNQEATTQPREHQKLEDVKRDCLKPPPVEAGKWWSCRYALAYLAFLGFSNIYALRVNLSVAILSMVNDTYLEGNKTSHETVCVVDDHSTTKTYQDGEFDWDEYERGLVLSSFFYGYFITSIPGGYLAARYGGKWLFGGGVFGTAFLTLLTPIAARTSFGLLIALRVMEGLVEGVTFPAMHSMWGRWAPPIERSFLVSFTYAGSQFGTVITQPITGLICSSHFLGGWPSVFYLFGSIGIIWSLVWFIFAHNSPEDHPRISQDELIYIQSTITETNRNEPVPWISIISSKPVWAITIAHFSNNWGFYTLITCLPIYLRDILGFDISNSGIVASLPYLVMWISINLNGLLADKLREKKLLTTTETRKLFNSLGLLGSAIFLVTASMVGCNKSAAVACICIAAGFNACVYPGCNANHIDLSPKYAGILMGLSNTFANISGFLSPIAVGDLTEGENTQGQWQLVFIIAAIIQIFGTIIFLIFASGEEQNWKLEGEEKSLLEDTTDNIN